MNVASLLGSTLPGSAGLALGAPALLLLGLSSAPHCVLMCAPLTQAAGPRRSAQLQLHLGRLGAYALLGALAGAAGSWLLLAVARHPVLETLRLLAAFALIALALQRWRATAPRPACCPPRPLLGANLPPALRGLLWGLLPCPMLYGVLAYAALTGSLVQGALLLTSFGLGTSPALLAASGLGAAALSRLSPVRLARANAVLIAASGVWIVATTPFGHIARGFCL